MANLKNSKTLFGFTSPRTIEKIIPEIQILVDGYEGQTWSGNDDLQAAFFQDLFDSEFYEGKTMPNDVPFAARDRITRAPKGLGFVDLDPVIKLTEVGKQLLSGKRTSEVIAKQLLKFQLPSPYHKAPRGSNFNVHPYLEFLRFVRVLGTVTKHEVAMFFLQMTDFAMFDSLVTKVLEYREAYKAHTGNKKAFAKAYFEQEVSEIFADEIEDGKLKGRQGDDSTLEGFLARKASNQIDYADAMIRYVRATQFITFDRNFRVIIAPSRVEEVDYLLANIQRDAYVFGSEAEYKAYLFSPDTLKLLSDEKGYIESKLLAFGVPATPTASVEDLKDNLESIQIETLERAIEGTKQSLKHYQEFDDVMDIFDKINTKVIPDPPLYLEWNIWRAMVMINYAIDVKGNFKLDYEGMPLTTAGAKMPDIEVEYEGFKMIVEVTMSSGQKQYDMEGEPVPRHFATAQNTSQVPVYCLFVAPKISEGTLAHFYTLNQKAPKFYGGKTRIVPMDLGQFRQFITTAREQNFNDPRRLRNYLDFILSQNEQLDDESVWFSSVIGESVHSWASA